MSSYAELIYLMGAMVVFSLLSVTTARNFNSTRQTVYQAEAEYRAIAVAQDEIDKVQWIYDPTDLDPSSPSYVYKDYPITEEHTYGNSNQYTSTFIINGNSVLLEDDGAMKKYQVTISVLNQEVTPEVFITMDYIKSYTY